MSIISSVKPSRWPSVRDILCRDWILPMIRYCRHVCSPILILSSAVWVARTSTRFQSISRFVHSTITSVTVYISVLCIPVKPVMSRTRLTITGRLKLRPQHKVVVLKAIRSVLMDTRSVSVANHSVITLVRPVFSTAARHHMSKSTLSMPMSSS